MNPEIEFRGVRFEYVGGVRALDDVTFSVNAGESLGIVGANGAGKTTLLLHINGLLPDAAARRSDNGTRSSGFVTVCGTPLNRHTLRDVRRRVGFVFQNPDTQLFMATVFDDVAFGVLHLGVGDDEVRRRVTDALRCVGLQGYEERSSHHLSYGEKKRIALATVLAMDPAVLVLDEPTAGLDPAARREFMGLVSGLCQTKIIAGHDLSLIGALCTRVLVMDCGRIVAEGPPQSIFNDHELLQRHRLQ